MRVSSKEASAVITNLCWILHLTNCSRRIIHGKCEFRSTGSCWKSNPGWPRSGHHWKFASCENGNPQPWETGRCEEVLTETQRGKSHVATCWHLSSRHRAPWNWVPPPNLVAEQGTAIRLKLHNALSPLLDAGFLEGSIRRHYQPLLDPSFDQLLAAHYPREVRIQVNGLLLEKQPWVAQERAPLEIRLMRKRKPSAMETGRGY